MITTFIAILAVLTTIAAFYPQEEERVSDEWGNIQRVIISGYTYENAQAMEPFISRDGRWLFFNSRNVGSNTSLHYALIINTTVVRYLGELGGDANGPIPHLDAVPAMDNKNNFFWVSTRNYPFDYENIQSGVFNPLNGVIPVATPVHGNFYIRAPVWIVMDQELNIDGSILFYVNALFNNPPGAVPVFSNISLALRNADGSYSVHPNAVEIMKSVNTYQTPNYLRYGPSSLGTDGLELYFTLRNGGKYMSALYVAKRTSIDDVFGTPELIPIPAGAYVEPEAPTLSADGNLMMFSRIDCEDKYGCNYINIYKMDRLAKPNPLVLN